MNTFFIEFRDPLFSIIVFFSIIFMISFSSYWWSKYKHQEDSKYLDNFLQKFRSLPSKNELKILISSGELSEKSWLLLAYSYSKSGDYEKSIEIYNEILKLPNKENSKKTMFLLGKTYFKAGFLERAKQIFLQILKVHPRTPQALHYLLLVYEQMHDYKAANGVLEPLEELNQDISLDKLYLNIMELLHRNDLTEDEKAKDLILLYNNNHQFVYLVFEYLFKVNPKLAWDNFDSSKSEFLSDILWSIDSKNLNLDIISKNGYLRELFSARGDIDSAKRSTIFEFDILIKLKNKIDATLNFEYICDNCKIVYPFVFYRCASCHSLGTSRVEWSLAKDYNKDFSEENNSFQ